MYSQQPTTRDNGPVDARFDRQRSAANVICNNIKYSYILCSPKAINIHHTTRQSAIIIVYNTIL